MALGAWTRPSLTPTRTFSSLPGVAPVVSDADPSDGLECWYAREDPTLFSSPFTADDASDHGALVRDRATDATVLVNVPADPTAPFEDADADPADLDAVLLLDDGNDAEAVRSVLDAAPDATVVRPAGVAVDATADRDDVRVVPRDVGGEPPAPVDCGGVSVRALGVVDADAPRLVADVVTADDRGVRARFTGRLDPTAVGEREEGSLTDLLGDGVGFASPAPSWVETAEALGATAGARDDGSTTDEVRVVEAPPNFTRAEFSAWDPTVTVMRPTRYNDLYFPEFDRPPVGRTVHRSAFHVAPDGTLDRGLRTGADRDPDADRSRGRG